MLNVTRKTWTNAAVPLMSFYVESYFTNLGKLFATLESSSAHIKQV